MPEKILTHSIPDGGDGCGEQEEKCEEKNEILLKLKFVPFFNLAAQNSNCENGWMITAWLNCSALSMFLNIKCTDYLCH